MTYNFFVCKLSLVLFLLVSSLHADAAIESVALESQLQAAKDVAGRLSSKAECYEQNRAPLNVKSASLQVSIGELLQKEEQIKEDINNKSEEMRYLTEDISKKSSDINALTEKMMGLGQTLSQLEWERRDCVNRFYLGFLCDFAMAIAGYSGEVEKLNQQIAQTSQDMQTISDVYRQESEHLDRLKREANENSAALNQLIQQRVATEKDVAGVIKNLSEVLAYTHTLNSLNRSLSYYSQQVASARPEDAFDEKMVLDELHTLSELMRRQEAEAGMQGMMLSNGERICAN